MEEDRVSTGRTLRRRKEKVVKHLKRGANEKEKENFQKRVFRIPLRGIVRDLEVQIDNALVPVDFHVLDIKLNWNSSLLLGRAFLSTVGAVCNLQTNQLCLTIIDPNAYYDPIPVKKPHTISRRINDARIIAACHCGAEKFYWEEKDEYEVYRDDRAFARDLDGHTILVHTKDIRRLLERASRDEPAYICLPEHASSFTQKKLVPEIYTKDEINEMFYGVCGEHEKNKEAF
ncbi:hypothetical protein F2Q70_00036026 [Brassica cretica]|uniref:Uncharacterized protein n=1 Tax=Brassica cretica TaxID=69181 RepID=A0A8S9JQU2_BRACR|nr:hypothetical protein F2Q70_00036026 [Brassica cretica]